MKLFTPQRARGKTFYFQVIFTTFVLFMVGASAYLMLVGYFKIRHDQKIQPDVPTQITAPHSENTTPSLFFREQATEDFSAPLVDVEIDSEITDAHWLAYYNVYVPKLPYVYAKTRPEDRAPWHTLPLYFVPVDTDSWFVDSAQIPKADLSLTLHAQLQSYGHGIVMKKFSVQPTDILSPAPFVVFLNYTTVDLSLSPPSEKVMSPILKLK